MHVMDPNQNQLVNPQLGAAAYYAYQQWLWRRLRLWIRLVQAAQRRMAEWLRKDAFRYSFYGRFFDPDD